MGVVGSRGALGAGPPAPSAPSAWMLLAADLRPTLLAASVAGWKATQESEEMKLGAKTTGTDPMTFPSQENEALPNTPNARSDKQGCGKRRMPLRSASWVGRAEKGEPTFDTPAHTHKHQRSFALSLSSSLLRVAWSTELFVFRPARNVGKTMFCALGE